MVRLNALIDLSDGGLREFAGSTMQTSELRNHDLLEERLNEGDVLVADRFDSGCDLVAGLGAKGVHFIGRTHQARKILDNPD